MTELTAIMEREAAAAATADYALATSSAVLHSQTAALDSPGNLKLLLISSSACRSELAGSVRAAGFDCEICEHQQALPLLICDGYDAALLDFNSAKKSIQLLENMRAAAARRIPLTAIVDAPDAAAAARAGASFAVPRPVASDLLRKTLAIMCRIAASQRRRHERYRVEVPVVLTVDGQAITAKATEVGNGGMGLLAPVPLQTGSSVGLSFFVPGTQQRIVATGEIRWSDHYGRVGLCFSPQQEMTGGTALENWIAQLRAGITEPPAEPAPAMPEAILPPAAVTSETASDPAGRTGRVVLSVVLALFCVFVVAFWLWLAIAS